MPRRSWSSLAVSSRFTLGLGLFLGLGAFQPVSAQIVACLSQCGNSTMIIGCDDRVRGADTAAEATSSSLPWRHVGRLDGGGAPGCSGTLIGPKHVLTAAHCLLDGNNDFRQGPIRFRLGQFSTGPCGRPYGDHYAVRAFVPADYDNGSGSATNKSLDWAVVELANPIPGAVPMDFGYLSWSTIQAKTAFTIGYPGDKTTGQVWETGNGNDFETSPYAWIDNGEKGLLYHSNDGVGGQSGSPLYVFHNGSRVIVGVFIGSPISHCQAGRTWSARLTPGTVEHIENAMLFPPNGNVIDFALRWNTLPGSDVLADVPPSDGCGF